jgi:hypothetical protein
VRRLPAGAWLVAIGWVVLGIALWNALFEMIVVRGVKDYLLRAELFAAGRGPATPIREVMDPAIHHAAWVATTWTAIVWLAAVVTIRYASSHPRLEPRVGAARSRGDAE